MCSPLVIARDAAGVLDAADRQRNLLALEAAGHGPGRFARSQLAGRSIRDSELRQRFGVIVVAIRRESGRMEFNPSPEAVLQGGDQLVLLGSAEQLRQLDAVARPAGAGVPT